MNGAEKIIAVTVDLIFSLPRNAEWNMHYLAQVKKHTLQSDFEM